MKPESLARCTSSQGNYSQKWLVIVVIAITAQNHFQNIPSCPTIGSLFTRPFKRPRRKWPFARFGKFFLIFCPEVSNYWKDDSQASFMARNVLVLASNLAVMQLQLCSVKADSVFVSFNVFFFVFVKTIVFVFVFPAIAIVGCLCSVEVDSPQLQRNALPPHFPLATLFFWHAHRLRQPPPKCRMSLTAPLCNLPTLQLLLQSLFVTWHVNTFVNVTRLLHCFDTIG